MFLSGSCLQHRNSRAGSSLYLGDEQMLPMKVQRCGFPVKGTASPGHPHLHHRCQLLPLLLPGIHSSGVVSTRMQEDDALLWNFLRKTLQ